MSWRDLLAELVRTGRFRTQQELVRALATRGQPVHQGSVSRELKARRIVKVDGVYVLPGPAQLELALHAFELAHGGGLAVLTTDPAFAPALAQAIDDAGLPGVLGTVAGDNTVFVALAEPEAARRLAAHVGWTEPLP